MIYYKTHKIHFSQKIIWVSFKPLCCCKFSQKIRKIPQTGFSQHLNGILWVLISKFEITLVLKLFYDFCKTAGQPFGRTTSKDYFFYSKCHVLLIIQVLERGGLEWTKNPHTLALVFYCINTATLKTLKRFYYRCVVNNSGSITIMHELWVELMKRDNIFFTNNDNFQDIKE